MKNSTMTLEANPNANHKEVIIIHLGERAICYLKVDTWEGTTSITDIIIKYDHHHEGEQNSFGN
jgi:hypothetical protein